MSAKLCPKIILEGTRLTFKTEIAFALNEHPRIVGPRNGAHVATIRRSFLRNGAPLPTFRGDGASSTSSRKKNRRR